MTHPFLPLARNSMLGLAKALRAGRLGPPFPRSALAGLVPEEQIDAVRQALVAMADDEMGGRHVAVVLEVLAEERADNQRVSDRMELVLSPPELDRVDARDTSVVVRDLFRHAKRSVLIVSYTFDAGGKGEALFRELAERMDTEPELDVRVYLNIKREYRDETPATTLVRDFTRRFQEEIWPGDRLPRVFYDPRSVAKEDRKRASLHAKCVAVDDRWTFLTSANFTEAAQERNIEAGVLVDDQRTAERVRRQFEGLVEAGMLVRLRFR